MSDRPVERDPIDLRAVIARIDRDLAENVKLLAEARKFNRERWILPMTAGITVVGGMAAGAIARLPEILHALGAGQ